MVKPHACTAGLKFVLLKMISFLYLAIHNLHESEKYFKFSEMSAFETKVLEDEVKQFPLINWSRRRTNYVSSEEVQCAVCSVHYLLFELLLKSGIFFQVFKILRT